MKRILDRPIHDTGSPWLVLLSFLLPIVGFPLAHIFRKRNYIRNFKACRKGAIAGVSCLGLLVLFFIFLILITLR